MLVPAEGSQGARRQAAAAGARGWPIHVLPAPLACVQFACLLPPGARPAGWKQAAGPRGCLLPRGHLRPAAQPSGRGLLAGATSVVLQLAGTAKPRRPPPWRSPQTLGSAQPCCAEGLSVWEGIHVNTESHIRPSCIESARPSSSRGRGTGHFPTLSIHTVGMVWGSAVPSMALQFAIERTGLGLGRSRGGQGLAPLGSRASYGRNAASHAVLLPQCLPFQYDY